MVLHALSCYKCNQIATKSQNYKLVNILPLACITGDVHHYLGHLPYPRIPQYGALQKKEHIFAQKYSNIIKKYNLSGTLFVTGKCIEQNAQFWMDLLSLCSIELGAHTYTAFQPWILHRIFYTLARMQGSPPAPHLRSYGPSLYQSLDIKRTLNAFKLIGLKPRAWRTHSYAGNSSTYELLEKFGFSTVSDKRELGNLKVTKIGKMIQVPITSIPDEKISYYYSRGMTQRMTIEGYRVIQFIEDSILQGKDIVLQLHPLCMKLIDNFKSFEKILRMLSENEYSTMVITKLGNNIGRKS